jgi:hypothetical protein
MANTLKLIVLPTYSTLTMAIVDASVYDDINTLVSPTLEINIPGYPTPIYDTSFVPGETNIYDSTDLGITTTGNEESLPDGIYCFKYTVDPPLENYVDLSIIRVDKLQQKFDEAFMQLDMMECDRAIKNQAKVNLNTIWFFLQGAIASANNCATIEAGKLYLKANAMLDSFLATNCGCNGNNYVINFSN